MLENGKSGKKNTNERSSNLHFREIWRKKVPRMENDAFDNKFLELATVTLQEIIFFQISMSAKKVSLQRRTV